MNSNDYVKKINRINEMQIELDKAKIEIQKFKIKLSNIFSVAIENVELFLYSKLQVAEGIYDDCGDIRLVEKLILNDILVDIYFIDDVCCVKFKVNKKSCLNTRSLCNFIIPLDWFFVNLTIPEIYEIEVTETSDFIIQRFEKIFRDFFYYEYNKFSEPNKRFTVYLYYDGVDLSNHGNKIS